MSPVNSLPAITGLTWMIRIALKRTGFNCLPSAILHLHSVEFVPFFLLSLRTEKDLCVGPLFGEYFGSHSHYQSSLRLQTYLLRR